MNDVLVVVANIYTWYELLYLLAVILVVIIAASLISYRKTSSGRLSLLFVTQTLLYLIVYGALSYAADNYFESVRNGYQQVGLIIGWIIVLLNIELYAIFYSDAKKEKTFDPDRVNRRHFASTLNTVVLTVILGASFGFFSPSILGQVLLVTSISAGLMVLANHLVILQLFKDRSQQDQNE